MLTVSTRYENLANRVHPLGALHSDVLFKDVYSFLNCLEISPCSGWMNSNATLRNETTARAVELSSVISGLAGSYPAVNFDVRPSTLMTHSDIDDASTSCPIFC